MKWASCSDGAARSAVSAARCRWMTFSIFQYRRRHFGVRGRFAGLELAIRRRRLYRYVSSWNADEAAWKNLYQNERSSEIATPYDILNGMISVPSDASSYLLPRASIKRCRNRDCFIVRHIRPRLVCIIFYFSTWHRAWNTALLQETVRYQENAGARRWDHYVKVHGVGEIPADSEEASWQLAKLLKHTRNEDWRPTAVSREFTAWNDRDENDLIYIKPIARLAALGELWNSIHRGNEVVDQYPLPAR